MSANRLFRVSGGVLGVVSFQLSALPGDFETKVFNELEILDNDEPLTGRNRLNSCAATK